MKKKLKKALSFALSFCMILSTFVSIGSFSAVAGTDRQTNLLSGLLPLEFYRAAVGTSHDTNWQDIGVINSSGATVRSHGFSDRRNYNKGNQSVRSFWEPYLAANTDADTTGGSSYTLDNALVWVYQLNTLYDLESISISFSEQTGDNNKAHFKIYSSMDLGTLFSATPVENTTDYRKNVTLELSGSANYIAIVVEKISGSAAYFRLNNIDLTGTECVNMLAGAIPTAFCTTNGTNDASTLAYNWTPTKVSLGSNAYDGQGFTESDGYERRVNFVNYLKYLTDEDDSVKLGITSSISTSYDVMIVYELKQLTNVKVLDVALSSWTDQVDVYLSNDRATVFSGTAAASFERAENAYVSGKGRMQTVDVSGVRFVGIHVKYLYQAGINEIRVYGTPAETISGENLLENLNPCAMYTVGDGTMTYSYNLIRLNRSNDPIGDNGFGHAMPDTMPSAYSLVSKATDGYTATNIIIATNWRPSDDIAVVYKLDSVSDINKLEIVSAIPLCNTKVYASRSYASLLTDYNKVGTFTGNGSAKTYTIDFEEDKRALYIGFVFDLTSETDVRIAEVRAYGAAVAENSEGPVLNNMAPVNPHSSKKTKDFYQYLDRIGKSDNMLLGAQVNSYKTYDSNGYVTSEQQLTKLDLLNADNNYYNYIEKNYGVSPAIVSFQHETIDDISIYKKYYDEGAIPLISLSNLSSFTADYPAFENDIYQISAIRFLDKTYTPVNETEQEIYDDMQSGFAEKLEIWGDFLEELEAGGVETYMVRFFIEMNIKSFFGDSYLNGTQYFKNVWQQMVDYFVNERDLQGILFVFAPSAFNTQYSVPAINYYPGNDYVDIIAPTVYSNNSDGYLGAIDNYNQFLATGKPFALSEIGPVRTYTVSTPVDMMNMLDSLQNVYANACFASLWYGNNFSIAHHINGSQFINDDYFISIENMDIHQLGYTGITPNIRIYGAADFAGTSIGAVNGVFNASQFGGINALSLKVNEGYKVSVYSGENAAGEKWEFGRDVADLSKTGSNIGSIKVEAVNPWTLYDANEDNEVNILDLVRIKKHLVGFDVTINTLAADADNSGRIEAIDLTMLVKHLLSK